MKHKSLRAVRRGRNLWCRVARLWELSSYHEYHTCLTSTLLESVPVGMLSCLCLQLLTYCGWRAFKHLFHDVKLIYSKSFTKTQIIIFYLHPCLKSDPDPESVTNSDLDCSQIVKIGCILKLVSGSIWKLAVRLLITKNISYFHFCRVIIVIKSSLRCIFHPLWIICLTDALSPPWWRCIVHQ